MPGLQSLNFFSLLRRSGLIFSALVIVLVGTELILRAWVTSPSRQVFDSELGWVYQPHATILNTREGGAHLTLNELGMNDSPVATESGVCRILVLGDSYTEALQLPREKNFIELAEDQTGLDLVNAGRSGLSPPQYVVLAERVAPKVRANEYLVVLTKSDWRDIEKALGQVKVSGEGQITLRSNAKDAARKLLEPLTQNSALLTYLMRRGGVVWKRISGHQWFVALAEQSIADSENGTASAISATRSEVETRQLARASLAALSRDKTLRLIYLPKLNYGSENLADSIAQSAEIQQKFQSIAADLGLTFLDTTTALLASYESTGLPTHGYQNASPVDGHPSAVGHQVIASTIRDLYTENPPCSVGQEGAGE